MPWAWLWVLVPLATATSLLLCWRFGVWGVLAPVAMPAIAMLAVGPAQSWVWWVPVAALTGAWMGLSEEGGGPGAGERAWMLLPLLLLAVVLPWSSGYAELVVKLQAALSESARQRVALFEQFGYTGDRLQALQREAEQGDALMKRMLPHALPALLFVWMALLVSTGRALAARGASLWRWPELSHRGFIGWRLPDAVIWLMMAGIGLLLLQLAPWGPSAWTLLTVPALGFGVQGVAVVESLMLARGVPPAIITLTLLFVFLMATPVFVLGVVGVGVSDVWLDYRRLEDVPGGGSI